LGYGFHPQGIVLIRNDEVMSCITLDMAKKQCNVESWFTDDDSYIELLCSVAEEKVARELNITTEELLQLGENGVPKPLVQAMLLTIGHYYKNREEAVSATSKPLEQGSKWLVDLYRDYSK